MYRKPWGLLLSCVTHIGEIDNTMVGEWRTARSPGSMRDYFRAHGIPTHIYCDNLGLANYVHEVSQYPGWISIKEHNPIKFYGPKYVMDQVFIPLMETWNKNPVTINKLQEQLEAKDREIHDLKCELERVRMINDGLFKRLGV